MAAEIHRELEETRAELKRGVLDLPRETQETTAGCAASSPSRSRR